jgi:SAM-dependent methyltransferase
MPRTHARRAGGRDIAVPVAEYIRDPTLNLHRRVGFGGLSYSDGAESEQRIYEAVRRARDRGTYSKELARAIIDWPSEYHLSRQRHCIVRPLRIAPGERVLEVGCGCGAITRYLGEIGADVTALEGSRLRGCTAAERCRDLSNVTVVIDDLLQFSSDVPFDWVLLVGVLEYAPLYAPGADPVGQFLRNAAALLAPHGRLVVAIENKLGLKYFNGCAEDHLGIPYSGVEGLYGDGSPCTFGRSELTAHVQDAGLAHVEMRYPFPDYKLSRVVLTEAGLADPGFDAAGMLAYLQTRDYGGRLHRSFEERLVARELARNGLLGDLSNSFLLVAARQAFAPTDLLATAFAAHRAAEFAVETRFRREDGVIRVHKERFYPERAARQRFANGAILENIAIGTDYVHGPLALMALMDARARGGDLAAIVAALQSWFDFLLEHAKPGAGRDLAGFTLPGDFLDATPFNLVETHNGLARIDIEWRIDREIPLGWVATRSIVHALWGIAGFESARVTVAEVVGALCERHRLTVTREEVAGWIERENELQELSSGAALPPGLVSRPLIALAGRGAAQDTCVGDLARKVADLEARIEQIYRSRSWRYSYPLRFVGGMLRAMRLRCRPGAINARVPDVRPRDRGLRFAPAREPAATRVWRYAGALAPLPVALAGAELISLLGMRPPRLLMCIAAVAVAARCGGLGPGLLATFASIVVFGFEARSLHQLTHDPISVERLAVFVVCAAIGIGVSVPRPPEKPSRIR